MRAAELIGPLTFRLIDMPIEDPGPGEVQVRIEAVGVCGSDLHSYSEGGVGGTPNVYPMLLGHEPAGRIVKTGAGVTGLAAGDRGALEPALYCYHCEFCLSGHHNVCANIRFLSNPHHPGFFRELVNLPVANFLSYPRGDVVCRSGTGRASGDCAAFPPPGVDPPGRNGCGNWRGTHRAVDDRRIAATQRGRVWAVEPLAHRRELARGIGADVALEPDEAVEEILRGTGQRGVDCAIDCAAGEQTTDQAIQLARNAGRVAMTGIHSTPMVSLEGSAMRRKELTIFNVRRSNHETDEALELLQAHPEWFAPLLTHTRELEHIDEAFAIASQYQRRCWEDDGQALEVSPLLSDSRLCSSAGTRRTRRSTV